MTTVDASTHARIPAPGEDRAVTPNFITDIVERDLREGRVNHVVTRFPPEPNGYLHIGHAKAICLDFGVAKDYGGITFLRFDDTNPVVEDPEFVAAIEHDIRWLGFRWHEVRHASDYFDRLYGYAVRLIERGLAYVDSLDEEEIRTYRGTVTEPGRPSPYRERSVAENLELFGRMRDGAFGPGSHVLRAKIDLASPNMKMRDPILYRIVDAPHHRTGTSWPIYPLYDFAHPLSDAIEGVTHSLCTLEFENNREIYDWLVDHLIDGVKPRQYEFARLSPDYTVMSKRKLSKLVHGGHVTGWDDPRMPTLSAFRRRGVTPDAIREFTNRVGVAKANSRTDLALLDHSIRDDLNARAPRVMAVLDPLEIELDGVEEGRVEWIDAPYWPHDVPNEGSRRVPLTKRIVIERADFEEDPPAGYRRLAPGRSVRLRHGPVVRCDDVVKDEHGVVTKLRCHVHPGSVGANPEGEKVWATVHWVSAELGLPMEARLYDRLFLVPNPDAGGDDFVRHLNPDALRVVHGLVEPSVSEDDPDTRYQFERLGYFWRDPVDGRGNRLVFNRIVALKDAWGRKTEAKARAEAGAPTGAPSGAPTGAATGATTGAPTPAEPQRKRAAGGTPVETTALDPAAQARADALVTLGVAADDAAQLSTRAELSAFYDATVAEGAAPRAAATWIVNEVARDLRGAQSDAEDTMRLTPAALASLLQLVDDGVITARVGKDVLAALVANGGDPTEIVRQRGLEQLGDETAVRDAVEAVLAAHPDELAAYRGGKSGLRGFFVGQVMRRTGGRADPRLVQRLVSEALEAK